ncbi:MAG: GNAT family N-acetyltransferase [Anaerolineae bacterium]|nr:GNAT family N-acetyltransferase [Phycisphaerae bacterium]
MPSLPILQSTAPAASPETLVRYFIQTERDYVRHLSEETPLDFGTAFHNAQLPKIHDANCILDAALPDGMSPADALTQAQAHFAEVGSTLWHWVMNPSAKSETTAPLAEYLQQSGFAPRTADLMRLDRVATKIVEVAGLKIIPSRASFRHARKLAEEASEIWNEPTLADAAMMHLDDPHWDSLIALRDNEPVAHVGVLSVGEIGRIDDVYVAKKYRRLGIGRTMMGRALEICARSLFKHVMLSVNPTNEAADNLYASLGFTKVGTVTSYLRNSD